jgi:hypothetical protein
MLISCVNVAVLGSTRTTLVAGEQRWADSLTTRIIVGVVAAAFLVLAGWRMIRDGARVVPSSKAWLITGLILAAVSAYLWLDR